MISGQATPSRPSIMRRPPAVHYAVVALLTSLCANLAVAEGVMGAGMTYFFGPVPMLLSIALTVVFTGVLALTRVFTGPQCALWTPAVLGVAASLVLSVGVFADSSAQVGPLSEASWLTTSYLALPPLLSALWFEGWETVRLREVRSAARAGDDAAAH